MKDNNGYHSPKKITARKKKEQDREENKEKVRDEISE